MNSDRASARSVFAFVCALLTVGMGAVYAQAPSTGATEIKDIKSLLTDSAAGHVSAASLLGLPADAVTTVENTRGLVAAVKGLGTADTAIGISLTPARTSIMPMSLSTYNKGMLYRLLGSTSLSYAQGSAKVGTTDMQRRAYAIETSVVFDERFDPVIGYLKDQKENEGEACKWEPPITPPGQKEDLGPANKKYTECVDAKMKKIGAKWNVSRASASFGTGSIQAPDKPSVRLGRTLAVSAVYGFDHFGISQLRENAALTLTYRRTKNAPVLESLLTPEIKRTSSQLTAVRFSFGSDSVRGLLERSNASERDVTATQRVFKQAAGADIRLAEGTWLAIRSGKQRKLNGMGDETVTTLDLSYSLAQKATLP